VIVSPQINFRTKIGLHFRWQPKLIHFFSLHFPLSTFCVARIKQMNLFFVLTFGYIFVFQFKYSADSLKKPFSNSFLFHFSLFSIFFLLISDAINFCMFSLVVSPAFDDLCMFLMPSTFHTHTHTHIHVQNGTPVEFSGQ